jgi:hypothetical protein
MVKLWSNLEEQLRSEENVQAPVEKLRLTARASCLLNTHTHMQNLLPHP